MEVAPCKGCTERQVRCHCTCKKYKAWRAECDELKAEQRKRQDLEYSLNRYQKDVKYRIYKTTNHAKKGR